MDTQRLKSIEFEMLKSFIEVCERLNLQYFVVGGTLLGAIRHRGFIPWDDDIDVGLMREDYEKFLQEAQNYLPKYYFVQNRKTDPELPNNYTKIRDSRTTFVENGVQHLNINHGVYIDIFPIDFYPESKWKQRAFDLKSKLLKIRIGHAFDFANTPKRSLFRKIAREVVSLPLMLVYPTIASALNAQEKLYKKEKNSRLAVNLCGAWGKREIMQASWLAETCDVEFEGMVVKAPKEYDKYLKQVYGDYMKFPPVEKQVSHHYSEIIDLDEPYTKYMAQ